LKESEILKRMKRKRTRKKMMMKRMRKNHVRIFSSVYRDLVL
jgi:hypothetical protein